PDATGSAQRNGPALLDALPVLHCRFDLGHDHRAGRGRQHGQIVLVPRSADAIDADQRTVSGRQPGEGVLTGEVLVARADGIFEIDRKSTRLNSSHDTISDADSW